MRVLGSGCLVACFLAVTGALHADEQAVLDKAIKAMGGAEKLGKFTAATVKCKLTHEHDGKQGTIEGEGAWQGLDKVRFGGEVSFGNESGKILMVINGDKGWMMKGGEVRDPPEGMVTALKSAFYAMRMPHLLPGLKDKAFTLAALGEAKVNDKPAVGISVNHKDRQAVSVFFDKETGLPAKSETRITEPEGKEITVEFFYNDFRDVNGVQHPMKITLKADGKEFVIDLSEIQPKDKVDESEFAKP